MGTVRANTRARHAELLRLLGEGLNSVDDLARAAGVSSSTVRRDLARLREQGAVARTYGGAMVAPPFHERPIGDSARHRTDAKAAIARRAREMLTPQGSVFLDAGTTCAALARLIAADPALGPLTVVTRGLETAVVLADSEHVDVHLLGGRLRRLSHGLVGPAASLSLERMAFDVACLGADAVDPGRGIGEPTLDETVLKEQVARVAQRCVVVADATKWEATAPSWTAMPGPWTWITDAAVGAGTGAGTDCEVVRA